MIDQVSKQMSALVYRGANDLRLEVVPVPSIGPDEILVKVAVCGVCPTDIKKIQYGTVPPPRIFGHETAGTIVQTGANVRDFRAGERVALHHHVPCQACHECRHGAYAQCQQYKRTGITAGFEPSGGGFAEYVRVMPFVFGGIVRIPDGNTFLEGAMLEPVNTVLKAVQRLALLEGDTVLVIGVGPIGLMFTKLLALRKARVAACDLVPAKLDKARSFGAQWTFAGEVEQFASQLLDLTGGRGVDAVVVAVPVDRVVREAQRLVRPGGKVLLFAHTRRAAESPVDLTAVCVDEKDLIGSYSADITIQQEVARTVFAREFDVRELVTHEFPLARAEEAIQLAAHPQPGSLKVIVRSDLP